MSTPADERRQQVVDTGLLVIAVIALWQLMHMLAGDVALASPLATLRRCGALLVDPRFGADVVATMRTFLLALAIATIGGIVIGLALGSNRVAGEAAEPVLLAFYAVPKVSFYPVILLVFGIGIWAGVSFGVIHGIVPVALFTMSAVRNIKPVYLKTAQAMGLSTAQSWATILLPSTAPEIFTGVRIGFSLTLIGTILSEMFGSRQGVGYLLMNAIGLNSADLILALVVLIVLFAGIANAILLAIDNHLRQRA